MKAPTEPGYYWAKICSDEWWGDEWEPVKVCSEAGENGHFRYGCMWPQNEFGILEWGDPIIRNPYPERPKESVELEKLAKSLQLFGHITENEEKILNDAIIFMDTLGPMLKLESLARIPKDTIP